MLRNLRDVLPLIVICLISVSFEFYSINLYFSSYAILNNFQIYVENGEVFGDDDVFHVLINFTAYNPSSNTLILKYVKPKIQLDGMYVELQEPSFIRTDLVLRPYANTTIIFEKPVKSLFSSQFFQTRNHYWLIDVYLTIRQVPLIDLANIQRTVLYTATGDI